MRVFDADAHVMESAEIFSDKYFDPELRYLRPTTTAVEGRPHWVIGGQIFPRWRGPGAHILGTPTRHGDTVVSRGTVTDESLGSLELTDPAARLADMDREKIDVQVLYPSLFLAPLTEDPLLAAAMARSYNRWLAEAVSFNPDRLKWIAYAPLYDVKAAVDIVKSAKRDGALGLVIYGTVGDKQLYEPQFMPFFEAAEAEQMPVAVHVGWSWPALTALYDNVYFSASIGFSLPVLLAFTAIVGGGVLDKVPNLKVGFFEAGVEWIHFCVDRLSMRYPRAKRLSGDVNTPAPPAKHPPRHYLDTGNLYFNCEVEDDLLPQVVDLVGEDQIVFASDMPHASRDHDVAQEFWDREDLSETAKRKILWDNGWKFYNLPVPAWETAASR